MERQSKGEKGREGEGGGRRGREREKKKKKTATKKEEKEDEEEKEEEKKMNGRKGGEERGKEQTLNLLFIFQMSAIAWAGSGPRNQELHPGLPYGRQELNYLDHHSLDWKQGSQALQ